MTTRPAVTPAERTHVPAIPYEALITALILLAALGLRVVQLGAAPLDPYESRQAVAALQVFRPGWPGTAQPASPLGHLLTLIAFSVAGPSEVALRFGTVLAGVGLVAAPLLFRHRLGPAAALTASAWLAVSPVAVGASRRMGGASLAMLALVLAGAALDRWVTHRQPGGMAAAGALVGAALVADYGTLAVLFAMAVGGFFAFLTNEDELPTPERLRAALSAQPWGQVLRAAGAAALLLATAFFALPGGLGAAADLLSRFLAGITQRVPGVTTPALALALYHPVLLGFGLLSAWRLTSSPTGWQRFLADWAVVALLTTALIYQGVRPEHMLWVVVPFAGLAGLAVQRLMGASHSGPGWVPWGLGLAVVGLAAMLFANMSQYLRGLHRLILPASAPLGLAGASIPLDLILAGLWLLLLGVLWFGTASMWGARAAWRGLGLGLLLVGLTGSAGQAGALAFHRATSPFEPMNAVPGQAELPLLVETAREVSAIATGSRVDAAVTLQGSPDRPVAWALREFTDVRYTAAATPLVGTPLVVTPATGADPALGSAYVGQDFVVARSWTPRGLKPGDMLRWALYRTAPTPPGEERVILWLREDIFRLLPYEIAPTN